MKSLLFWLKLLIQGSRSLILFILLLIALQPFIGWFIFKLNKEFFDTLTISPQWSGLLIVACLMMGVRVAELLLNQVSSLMNSSLSLRAVYRLEQFLFSGINPRTITSVETPEFSNDINMIRSSLHTVEQLIGSFIGLIHQALLVMIYGYLIIQYNWSVLLLLVVFAVPVFIYEMFQTMKLEAFFQNVSQNQISSQIVSDIIVKPQALKETLVFGMKDFLINKWEQSAREVISKTMILKNSEFRWRSGIGIFQPLGFLVIQLILIRQIIAGGLTVGDYIAITAAIGCIEGSVLAMSFHVRVFKQAPMLSRRFSDFKNTYCKEQEQLQPMKEHLQSVVLHKLLFQYPGVPKPVLHGISLGIRAGDVIAIVGENGSGKSTLGKILMGLHEVLPGSMYINGIDINEINREELFQHMTVVNQDYMRYPFSIYENISLRESNDETTKAVERMLSQYPMLVPSALRSDMHTILGNNFLESRQLSGGQWQRMAIARALYKDSPFMLLDEATSELDPASEKDLISDILVNRKGKTTIIVTHNLMLSSMADRVIVMHDGEIVEQADHHTLIRQQGRYGLMWSKQNEMKGEQVHGQSQLSGSF